MFHPIQIHSSQLIHPLNRFFELGETFLHNSKEDLDSLNIHLLAPICVVFMQTMQRRIFSHCNENIELVV